MRFIAKVDGNWNINTSVHIPEDDDFLLRETDGKTVIMDKERYDEFTDKEELSNNRTIIVYTDDKEFEADNVIAVYSVSQLLDVLNGKDGEEVYCIGGEQMYDMLLEFCDKIFITCMNKSYDTSLDEFLDETRMEQFEWIEASDVKLYENSDVSVSYWFCTYNKKPEE